MGRTGHGLRLRGRDDAVHGAPDHRDRHLPAAGREGGGGAGALRLAVQERAHQGVQRRLDPVQPLVGEQVVDQLAGYQALVGEQLADDRLELAPRLRVGEAAQVAGVDLRAEAGGRDQGERGDPERVPGGGGERHGAAQRVTHQMGALDADRVEHPENGAGQHLDRAVADVLGGRAVPGQVERVDAVPRGHRLLQEQPGVAVAAVAVDEQHHVAVLAGPGVADLPPADLGRLDGGAALRLVGHAGVDHRAGLRHGGVEVAVADAGGSDQRDGAADGDVFPHPGDDAPQGTGVGRLQRPGDLLRLDVREVVAGAHVVALGHDPGGDLAELHRQAPLRHRHRDDPLVVLICLPRGRFAWSCRRRASWRGGRLVLGAGTPLRPFGSSRRWARRLRLHRVHSATVLTAFTMR